MKLTGNYKTREVMGELLLVPCGKELNVFNGIRTLNGMGRTVYEMLETVESADEIADKIFEDYDVTREEAKKDIVEFLNSLREMNVIE